MLALTAVRASRGTLVASLDALPGGARIVVLGCRTHTSEGRPNRLLEARIAAGAAAYHALCRRDPAETPRVLATGYEALGEIGAMRAGLLAAGVPEEALDLDPDAMRTIDSIVFLAAEPARGAARSGGATRSPAGGARDDAPPLVLVSQRFHLPRALWLARAHGLEAWGLPARGRPPGRRGLAREALAWLRAFVDVARRRLRA